MLIVSYNLTKAILIHTGMEMAQLICGGCRTLLMHARGAASVRCSCCHTVNLVPGMILMDCNYVYGAWSFYDVHLKRFSITLLMLERLHMFSMFIWLLLNDGIAAPAAAASAAPPPAHNNIAHVNCGNCHTMLMYPAGAPSVKCAICHFITNVNVSTFVFTFLFTLPHMHLTIEKNLASRNDTSKEEIAFPLFFSCLPTFFLPLIWGMRSPFFLPLNYICF